MTVSVLGGVRHLTFDVLRTSLVTGPAGAMIMSEIVMAERKIQELQVAVISGG